jgi:hypothetical protein
MFEKSKPTLDRAVDQLVDYMLFVEEAPLREPVEGVSSFTATFPQRGPRDSHGRSLGIPICSGDCSIIYVIVQLSRD